MTQEAGPHSDAEEPPRHGVDGLLRRYSRWRETRLTKMAATPLGALALQNGLLSLFILLDGVVLPWIVVVLEGGFSFVLFAILLVPALVLESLAYRRLKAPEKGTSEHGARISDP